MKRTLILAVALGSAMGLTGCRGGRLCQRPCEPVCCESVPALLPGPIVVPNQAILSTPAPIPGQALVPNLAPPPEKP
jgi:hypothetical protein